MSAQTIVLRLPETLYRQLQRRAERAQRSVEDELLEVVATAVPTENELPSGLASALAELEELDDPGLWNAARSSMQPAAAHRLADLNEKAQREGLSPTEVDEQGALIGQYEQAMLVRARAAVLLKNRGHDVADLAPGA
jgi:plasmid stability protein